MKATPTVMKTIVRMSVVSDGGMMEMMCGATTAIATIEITPPASHIALTTSDSAQAHRRLRIDPTPTAKKYAAPIA
jgi:hypothetical protein